MFHRMFLGGLGPPVILGTHEIHEPACLTSVKFKIKLMCSISKERSKMLLSINSGQLETIKSKVVISILNKQ